jgi:putative ABC transport system permease protein
MKRAPRVAEWLLARTLPPGKRGDSIRGDLLEEFQQQSSWWYWQQTLRLIVRYATSGSPQPRLDESRRVPMWFDVTGDLKTALRMLRRNPGTSSLIVATLALAIGAATIGFAFADLALFRGLPVDDNARVVTIFAADTHGSTLRGRTSAPDLLDYRARATTLEELSGMRGGRAALIRNGQSLTLTVNYATANVFAAMGQTPLAGRALQEGDDVPGAPLVAVLSHRYWRDEMDGRPDAIGRTLQIGRDIVTVVGVLRPNMEFGNLADIDLWLPQPLDPGGPRDRRDLRFMARLREGVTFDQAAAEITAIGDALASEYPLTNGGWKIRLVPIREITGGDGFWAVIFLFMFSMATLIAIATANVSNLIMVRAAARARELAVRTAMGAKGGRLFRQFFVEGLILAAIGALLSVPVAWTALQLLVSLSPEPAFRQIVIDEHELAFVASLALICPVVFSLASVRLIVRPDLREVLATQGGRGSTTKMRGRGALVVAQVALAVVMLTASSLAAKSIRAAFGRPLGMSIDRLLIFGMEFNDAVYPAAPAARAAADATREALAAIPGVTRVTSVNALPVLGDFGPIAITVDDRPTTPGEPAPMGVVTAARADAATTLGVGLRAGRWWTEGTTNEAVITQATATRHFDGVDRAIGRHFSFQSGDARLVFQVVGVSTDVASTDRQAQAPSRIWVPMQASTRRMTFIIEGQNPAMLASGVRSAAASVAPAVPVENLRTFTEAMQRAQSSDYLIIAALAGFALVALVLASAGLFGVVSFSVSQRTAEFGTRMALGAPASAVVGLVVRQSGRLLALGLTIGLIGGVAVGFAMRGLLFGTSPADPATLTGVTALLVIVSLLATAWPAWRAARIDPVVALRSE